MMQQLDLNAAVISFTAIYHLTRLAHRCAQHTKTPTMRQRNGTPFFFVSLLRAPFSD
jgi:hypothetical protein